MKQLQNNLLKHISFLYRMGQIYFDKRLENYGLGSGRYPFLLALYNQDGQVQESLSSLLKIDKGTTAKALKKLEESGYITRKLDTQDKRKQRVFLTDQAKSREGELRQCLEDWRESIFLGVSEEEQAKVTTIIETMSQNAETIFIHKHNDTYAK